MFEALLDSAASEGYTSSLNPDPSPTPRPSPSPSPNPAQVSPIVPLPLDDRAPKQEPPLASLFATGGLAVRTPTP